VEDTCGELSCRLVTMIQSAQCATISSLTSLDHNSPHVRRFFGK